MNDAPIRTGAAPQGDNNPPADPFMENLEARNASLIDLQGELELDSFALPKSPASDEDVAKITAWVVRARTLARDAEKARVKEKADALEIGRKVDGWFGRIKEALAPKIEKIEQRSGPYLEAKRIKEEAAAAERARLAKIEADRLAEIARKEAEAVAEREKERQEAEQRLRDAEAAEQARLASERAQAEREDDEDEGGQIVSDDDPGASDSEAAEEDLRAAHIGQQEQSRAATEAAANAQAAQVAADRAERLATGGANLSRSAGGGGAARTEKVWVAKVRHWPAVLQTLGPWQTLFSEQQVRDAIERAAKQTPRPQIQGLDYSEEIAVKTTASRGK